jgi:predicted RNase H-like nuclease (RuvC/YqgF family)
MSYYEDRIKALEGRIEEMAMLNRMKAVPVEAKLMDRIGELNAENASLKAEVERLTAFTTRTIIPNEELQAQVNYLDQKLDEELDKSAMLCGQVERLTKAGDAMACHLVCSDLPNDVCGDLMQRWNAAKEGKGQS